MNLVFCPLVALTIFCQRLLVRVQLVLQPFASNNNHTTSNASIGSSTNSSNNSNMLPVYQQPPSNTSTVVQATDILLTSTQQQPPLVVPSRQPHAPGRIIIEAGKSPTLGIFIPRKSLSNQ